MREIKFRAWDKEVNIMEQVLFIAFDKKGLSSVHSNGHIIPDFILMQFTGLKDKNDVEIYEGDVVQINCIPILLSEVIYIEEECRFILKTEKPVEFEWTFMDRSYHSMYEVIGNIHKNKELLNGHQT